MAKKTIIYIVGLLLTILLSLGTVKPLIGPGFFPMHDDTQVGRVVSMGRALRNGQFPVRWVSDLGYGYGYPLYNFYAPLPYYAGGYLHMLGVSGLWATKGMILLGVLLSAVFMYIASVPFVGVLGAMVGALFYIYAPYHAVQIYVRGSVGELWAIAFLPLLMSSLCAVVLRVSRPRMIVGSIGLAGIILSHTILGYSVVVLLGAGLFFFGVWSYARKNFSVPQHARLLFIILLGLCISSFFWIPAIGEMSYTRVSGQISASADYRDHFVCLGQLWTSPWGFGGSAKGCHDGLSLAIGKVHIGASLFAVLAWIILRKRDIKVSVFLLLNGILMLFFVYFVTDWSRFIWEKLPLFAYTQYPWRFLAFISLGAAGLVAALIGLLSKHRWIAFGSAVMLVASVIGVNAKWFAPQYLYERPIAAWEDQVELRYRVSKISDEYLPPIFTIPKSAEEIARDTIPAVQGIELEKEIDTETYGKFFVTTRSERTISIQKVFFPGWHYYVNGREIQPEIVRGIPWVTVPAGRSAVEMRFIDTPLRTVGNLLSIVGGIIVMFFYGRKSKQTKY